MLGRASVSDWYCSDNRSWMMNFGTNLRGHFISHGRIPFPMPMNMMPYMTGIAFRSSFMSARTTSGDIGWILNFSPLILRLTTTYIECDSGFGPPGWTFKMQRREIFTLVDITFPRSFPVYSPSISAFSFGV
jgi:hypothetical protein